MAIILRKRPSWLNEFDASVSRIGGAMRLRSELDAQKASEERQKREEERQKRLDSLHESLAKSQEARAQSAEERARAQDARSAELFPLQRQAAENTAEAGRIDLERRATEADAASFAFGEARKGAAREEAKFAAGKEFWKKVAETPPDQLQAVIGPMIGELPANVQEFAWEEIRRGKRGQVFQQRFASASDALERALKDGVYANSVDEKGNSVTDQAGANEVAEMAQGLAEWRDLVSSGDPDAEEIARTHPFSPDKVQARLSAQRAKRAVAQAEQASNVELAQQLEAEYAALPVTLFPPGSQERFAVRLAIDAFLGKITSANGDDRANAIKATREAVYGGVKGSAEPIDLGGIKIARDPKVPLEGVDWAQASDAQKARLEGYALERLYKRMGSQSGIEPTPEQVARETTRLARELGWTGLEQAAGGRSLDDLTGKERKQMEADAAGGMEPDAVAKKYGLNPDQPVEAPAAKLKPIGDVPKAKRYQVGQALIQAQRDGLTGADIVTKLRELGIDPQSVFAMSQEEHAQLLRDAGLDTESSVLNEKPEPKKKPVRQPGSNRGW